MHQGHDHHHHGNGGGHSHGPGHNHAPAPKKAAQWQTPHLPDQQPTAPEQGEPDLDLVESAFVESFTLASDPTSFLRLAQVPFEARDVEGVRLVLLRVETQAVTDMGSITPHVGGGSFRYDPLPAVLVSKRRQLRFVYTDGKAARPLDFAQMRTLSAL